MTTSGIIFFSILFVLLLIFSWLVCNDFSIDKYRWLIYILLTPFYALIAACMELVVIITIPEDPGLKEIVEKAIKDANTRGVKFEINQSYGCMYQ